MCAINSRALPCSPRRLFDNKISSDVEKALTLDLQVPLSFAGGKVAWVFERGGGRAGRVGGGGGVMLQLPSG